MKSRYDLCVLGSGPGGEKAAIQAAKLGKSVCVVEARDRMGGVAVNTGTIPSKALREMIRRLVGASIVSPAMRDSVVAFRPDTMKRLWADYEQIVHAEGQIVREHLVSNGVDMVIGRGRFVDANTVEVVHADGSTDAVAADYVLIAVGTEPTRPEGIPFDRTSVITTDELLLLESLPHSIVVVGGGVVGTEYASMLALLGIRITVVEGRARLLEFA
ncbi:MAG: FAD-dependent oxidoreductase, partial [Alphaproteobacteria bacterium]